MRKIIQITSTGIQESPSREYGAFVYTQALCDDGTVWTTQHTEDGQGSWKCMAPIPQQDPDES